MDQKYNMYTYTYLAGDNSTQFHEKQQHLYLI